MARINVKQLRPGMVLGEDLRNYNGRFLLNKGVRLTENHLRVMKIWGITDAEIEGMSKKHLESRSALHFDPEVLKEAMKLTKTRFRHSNFKHPAIRELFRICTIREALALNTGGANRKPAGRNGCNGNGQCTESHPVMDGENLQHIDPYRMVQDDIKLPSLPSIFRQIQDIISNPRSSAHCIADVISKDASLTVRLLKLVNSPFYGFPSKIDSLSRAVTIVGTKQLSTLAMGICITNTFKSIPKDLINLESFWKHSIACGMAARILGKFRSIANSERLFIEGLLHDIGRLIIFAFFPAHARAALTAARRNKDLLYGVELDVLGTSHTTIGAVLLKEWKLPVILEATAQYHHEPEKSQHTVDASLIHMADIIVNALGIGSSGESFVPPLSSHAWESLCLPVSVFDSTARQLDHQLTEIVRFFANE